MVFLMSSLWIVIVTSIQLLGVIVNWQINMFLKFILWTVSITTLPIRALSALRKEKKMERLLQEMQSELESLLWENEKLTAHLKLVVKEHRFMESMLAEIEDEHDKAIGKIESLEKEVEHLKEENLRLKEVRTKGGCDPALKDSTDEKQTAGDIDKYGLHESPLKFRSHSNLTENLQLQENTRNNKKKLTTGTNSSGLVDPLTPLIFSTNVDVDVALNQRREVAFSQSVFSAMLSLLVGVIIWEAKDPCMPLVMALFTVVGLSLRSVVQFFSTIRNRPAADAVALLSLNWFILGTLSYPTLPKVAHVLSPIAVTFLERGLGLSGFSNISKTIS